MSNDVKTKNDEEIRLFFSAGKRTDPYWVAIVT